MFENKIMKEFGVFKKRQTVAPYFLSNKKFKAISQSAWCTKHLGIMTEIMSQIRETEKKFEKIKS